MTTIQDQTIRTARANRSVEDRADMLRRIAGNWDDTIFTWDRKIAAGTAYGMTIDNVIDGLSLAAAEYAAPDLPMVEVRSYMEQLRDAVHALARYETGNGWDGDEDPEKHYYTDETVLTLLNADVDWALWPLLTGLSIGNVCFRCSRGSSAVTWNTRVAGLPNCAAHS